MSGKEVGALAAIFDDQGRILLVHQTYAGKKWAYPGGAVEDNESPWAAVVREVKEETGLDVEITRLVSIYYIRDRNGIGFHFDCRVVGGELQVDGIEVSEARFFDPAHLPTPMTKPARQRLLDVLANSTAPFFREYATVEVIQAE
jgi:ADP-ribose pyrophosphatase YjhB (NUDIX family)